jgi:hypothetical protein
VQVNFEKHRLTRIQPLYTYTIRLICIRLLQSVCTFFPPIKFSLSLTYLFTSVRAAFFICAIHAWDPELGKVYRTKVEFYSLDEISSTLFFSLASILALFWAELYYISIDRVDIYNYLVRPVTYVINLLAFFGVIVCSIVVTNYYADDVDYIFLQYTILVTTTYIIAAVMFACYAYVAALELENVPLPITARRDRLFSLRLLACICIIALALKASASIYMNGRTVPTNNAMSLVLVYFYFFFCEIFPICVILIFYRVDSNNSDDSEEKDNGMYSSVERHAADFASRTPRTSSPMKMPGTGSQPDVVEAIIARLSLETGFYAADDHKQINESDTWANSGERDGLLPARGSSRYQNLSL